MKPITITRKQLEYALPITRADLIALIGEQAVNAGERRFKIESVGPWGITRSIRGLACEADWKEGALRKEVSSYTFHGDRTGHQVTQPGTWAECRVSIGGKKRTAFTSSVMFQTEDGKLIEVAVLHFRPIPA